MRPTGSPLIDIIKKNARFVVVLLLHLCLVLVLFFSHGSFSLESGKFSSASSGHTEWF
jgi:hypothetical protein